MILVILAEKLYWVCTSMRSSGLQPSVMLMPNLALQQDISMRSVYNCLGDECTARVRIYLLV